MTAVLLVLAALGWVLSSVGAVLTMKLGTHLAIDTDGTPFYAGSDEWSRRGLVVTILGASFGGVGTVVAVLAT